MSNRSVWLSSLGTSKNISNPTLFSSNESVFCSWKVYVPKGFHIRVHFNSFDVKNSSDCSRLPGSSRKTRSCRHSAGSILRFTFDITR